MSRKKVRDLIDREGLPAYDFGDRALRIPAGEFEEWEESRRITARRAKEEASQKA